MRFSIMHFCSVLIILLSVLTLGSNAAKMNLTNSDSKYILIFQQTEFNIPLEKCFEITIKLTEGSTFSRPKILYTIAHLGSPLSSLGEVSRSVIETLCSPGNVVALVDVSPDKRWVAVLCKAKYTETSNGKVIFINQGYLIDVEKAMIAKKLPILSPCYFSFDSKYCFFNEGWNIKRMNLYSKEISDISVATSFFVLPGRDKLIFFDNGEIWIATLDGDRIGTFGTYEDTTYASGVIDKNWGYFLTSSSAKGGMKELFFINFTTKSILRYPYKLPEARLIRVIK